MTDDIPEWERAILAEQDPRPQYWLDLSPVFPFGWRWDLVCLFHRPGINQERLGGWALRQETARRQAQEALDARTPNASWCPHCSEWDTSWPPADYKRVEGCLNAMREADDLPHEWKPVWM